MRWMDAVVSAFIAVVIVVVAVAVAMVGTAHAGQFERMAFAHVGEPRFEPPAAEEEEPEPEEAAEEAWIAEGWYEFEPTYYEPTCEVGRYEPAWTDETRYAAYEPGYAEGATDFRTQGVVYEGGTRYTWYSQNVLPGGGLSELNANGRTVDEGGYVVDGDGYIAVASSDHEMGTVLDTPFGQAKVYDTGCASGTVDVYVGW